MSNRHKNYYQDITRTSTTEMRFVYQFQGATLYGEWVPATAQRDVFPNPDHKGDLTHVEFKNKGNPKAERLALESFAHRLDGHEVDATDVLVASFLRDHGYNADVLNGVWTVEKSE